MKDGRNRLRIVSKDCLILVILTLHIISPELNDPTHLDADFRMYWGNREICNKKFWEELIAYFP
jgi:hypothetical protein